MAKIPRTPPTLVLLVVAAMAAAACGPSPSPTNRAPTTTAPNSTAPTTSAPPAASSTTQPADDPVVLAAGDIASCQSQGDEATAALLAGRPGTVITLGDNVYETGNPLEFAGCYDSSWGAQKHRTRPSPGNHDYATPGASGYFGYFGAAAGDPTTGYYSYDVGTWHVVALNSNCSVVSCAAGGAQEAWLRADLAAHHAACTLAYWHHPRFSSGTVHGSDTAVQPLWQALYDLGADLVLAGHEHNYERFGPLDPDGEVDPARGLRSFVVGTGGRSHYGFGSPITGSEVRDSTTFGVLALVLHPAGYDWEFVPEAGSSFRDSGSAACH
jgi:acid phosphatase type 7